MPESSSQPTLSQRRISRVANAGLVVAGVTITSLGPSLPFLIREYGLSLTIAGAVFAFFAGGRIGAVLISTQIAERFERKTLLTLGHGGFALGLIAFAFGVTWWMHLAAISLAGIGYGFTDVLSNAVVAEIYPDRRGFALNRLQAYYGIGCIVGPLFAASILGMALSWRWIYIAAGVVALLVTGVTINTEFPAREVVGKRTGGSRVRLGFLRRPALLIPAFAIGMYTGVGNGLIGWINTYFEELLGAPTVVATLVLLGYNAGITAGRFLGSAYSDRLGYVPTIALNSLAATLVLLVGALSGSVVVGAISFALTGLFLAGIAPTAMAAATSRDPERAGAVSSRMFIFGAGGSLVIPFLMGATGDLLNLRAGMGFDALLVVTIVPASLLLSAAVRREQVCRASTAGTSR